MVSCELSLYVDPEPESKYDGPPRLHSDYWYRDILGQASESVGIRYGQRVPGGWTTHDLRHTCLTNLAMAGVPINGIKEYAGHASIVETQKYLKFMPQSIDLAASVSTRLAALAKVVPEPNKALTEKPPRAGR